MSSNDHIHRHRLSLALFLLAMTCAGAQAKNGFDLSSATLPASKILHGGPPKDGIPSLDNPVFLSADKADYIEPDDRILGFVYQGKARAYPIKILNWHEIVNDQIGDFPFVLTYCPLCGTGMAFEARLNEQTLRFGVSGLLYQSDVLLYDRQSHSLWSQILGKAISGPKADQSLTQLPLIHASWQAWREQYPNTLVLSTDTGFLRDYTRNPYGQYSQSKVLYFDVEHQAPKRYHPKQWVLGIKLGQQIRAYPFVELSKSGKRVIEEQLGEQKVRIIWDEGSQSAHALDSNNQLLVTTQAYWFAWYTFYPETSIFQYSSTRD